MEKLKCLEWAKELQFIAQAGITYSKDPFDLERFERIREISAEIMSSYTHIPIEEVHNLFCNETGYQTPKLDTRAAIFENGKILLVKEKSGLWALPGGWVDVTETIKSNTIKEVKEETGLNVEPLRIIALHDKNKHNPYPHPYNICKVFVLCKLLGGAFVKNTETTEIKYFEINEIPQLAEEKTTIEQVRMCFDAYKNDNFAVEFD